MKPRKILIPLLLLLNLFLVSKKSFAAGEPAIEMSVDRDTVSTQEQLLLTITIKGGSAMSSPEMASQGNFEVLGKSSANAIQVINGEMQVSKSFEYTLAPRKVGEFLLGPVKTQIDGKTYTAGPVRVKVVEGSGSTYQASPTPPPQNFPNFPPNMPMPGMPNFPPMPGFPPQANEPLPPSGNLPPGANRQATFLTAELNKTSAYVGEQVVFTFRLYTSVNVQEATLSFPDFKDFISEELVKERKYQVDLEGRRYAVNEWRLALFPTKSGELQINETVVKAAVPQMMSQFPMSGFGAAMRYEARTFTSPRISLQVKDLPPSPAGFTGLVGHFSASSQMTPQKLNLGETANLEIALSGSGNIGEGKIPDLPDLPDFKVYPSKPILTTEKSPEGLQGKKVFKYALVAERPGNVTFPELEMSYFDPQKGAYERLSTPAVNLAIQGSANSEKLVTAGIEKSESLLGKASEQKFDLHELKAVQDVLQRPAKWPLPVSLLVGLLAFLSYAIYVATQTRRKKLLAHSEDRRRSQAFKTAKQKLAKASKASATDSSEIERKIFQQYLGDRFLIKADALTPQEVTSLLHDKNLPQDLIDKIVAWMQAWDSWKYGGAAESKLKSEKSPDTVLNLLREMEKNL